MESDLNKPVFTDPVVLKFLDENWLFSHTSSKVHRDIPAGHSIISIRFDSTQFPSLYIDFRTDNFVGSFSYHLEKSPISMEMIPISMDTLFMETFGRQNSYLSKTAAIEKLMTYPDFREWLLWNRP